MYFVLQLFGVVALGFLLSAVSFYLFGICTIHEKT